MRYALATALVIVLAAPAFAQSVPAVQASAETSRAVAAIGETGLRATSGAVTIPLGVTALASGAVGVGLGASGQTEIAGGFSSAAADTSRAARALAIAANAPLTVTDDVVTARVRPQPAPHVPYKPQ